MRPAPVPSNEEERLKDLAAIGLLDSTPEVRFDQLTKLAVRALGVKAAKIVLVDRTRLWVKSHSDPESPREIPRQAGLCAHTIMHGEIFVVNDTETDSRFGERPAPGCHNEDRFYAGIPLMGPRGFPVGVFSITDSAPRKLSEEETELFRHLADIVQNEILHHIRAQSLALHIAYQARFDDATGLPNRKHTADMLAEHIQEARPRSQAIAVVALNLDQVGRIERALGSEALNTLLCGVAVRLRDAGRSSDQIGRIGTDRIAILLPEIGAAGNALKAAGRLRDVLAEPFDIGGRSIRLVPATGISLFPDDGDDPSQLIRFAELAADQVKTSNGVTNCFYTPSLNDKLGRHLTMETDLWRGIAGGELSLHFQPKIELTSGRLVGAEGLLRWQNSAWGAISPVEFIPVAEESGLIIELGQWVIREACQQIRRWLDQGYDVPTIAINVSERQIRAGTMPDVIASALAESGIESRRLSLEVTEGAFINDLDFARREMMRIVDQGVSIALDDFGTGYSSLSYLQRLPVDTLKIDRGFVKELLTSPESRAIISATIAIARTLALNIVAEGVETDTQRRILLDMGCEQGQGYMFGRPEPAEAFIRHLRRRAAA